MKIGELELTAVREGSRSIVSFREAQGEGLEQVEREQALPAFQSQAVAPASRQEFFSLVSCHSRDALA
jgi:hypothetical protein